MRVENFEGSGSISLKKRKSLTGTAIVFNEPLDLETMVNHESGKIINPGRQHDGKSIRNKIIIAPKFSFNPDLELILYLHSRNNCTPKALVLNRASSNLVLGAVMADLPILYGFEEDITSVIQTGDGVTIDFENTTVSVKKK